MKLKYAKQITELIKGLTTKYPTTMSCMLTCPKCKDKFLQCNYFGNTHSWNCLVRECSFKTNEIPSIKDMEELLELDNKLHDLKSLKNHGFIK